MKITRNIAFPKKQVTSDESEIEIGKMKKIFNIEDYAWLKLSEVNRISRNMDAIDEYIFFLHYVSDEEIKSIALHESNIDGIYVFSCTTSSKNIFYCIQGDEGVESLFSMTQTICELMERRNESYDDLVIDTYNSLIDEERTRISKYLDEISFPNF